MKANSLINKVDAVSVEVDGFCIVSQNSNEYKNMKLSNKQVDLKSNTCLFAKRLCNKC